MVVVSYVVYFDKMRRILLQNVTDRYSITKCDKSLLQNESGFLLQNALVQVPATMPQLVERFFLISKEIQFWL